MSATDPKSVVRQVMQLFWLRGTNVPFAQIVEVTGMSRKALYAMFGDKATLIGAALGLYRQEVLDPMLALLEPPNGTAKFWQAYEKTAGLPNWNGCLLVRASTTDGQSTPLVQDAFRSYSQQFVASMKAAYIREGEVGDPEVSAWAAFGIMISITALAWNNDQDDRIASLFNAARAANREIPDIEDDHGEKLAAS